MGITGIDHLYLETRSFDRSVAFWRGLGFRLAAQWGEGGHRAGRLECGAAAIVLAESAEPVQTVHFRIADAEALARRLADSGASGAVEVTTPLEETHWNTRWIRVADPDGRVYALEETGA